MPDLINPTLDQLNLGVSSLDETHVRFISLVNRLGASGKHEFINLFEELVDHIHDHFASEKRLMQISGFPAIHEHQDEHDRVMGELSRIWVRVRTGSLLLGRAYVMEQLPQWFHLHVITMDSALAAHLKTVSVDTNTLALAT